MTLDPRPVASCLVADGIEKAFGASRALRGAGMTLAAGEVHGLLGANGAGKSTLSRVIAGHVRPDRGTLTFEGRPLAIRNPRDALDTGIMLVTQETSLAPDLSVMENIFLADMRSRGAGRRRQRGAAILDSLGMTGVFSLDARVETLSIAQRQLVEIAKALAVAAKVVIFDEPTSSLSPSEVERLFVVIRTLRDDGCAIAFVSHRLEEVFAITDRVTVLREGRAVAASVPTASLSQSELIRIMVGQELASVYHTRRSARVAATTLLRVDRLQVPPLVHDISFELRPGEILGLAGLVGAGRSETVEAIFGLRRRRAGTMTLNGAAFAPRRPTEAIRAGLALVPEDRRRQAIAPDLSVRENLLLGALAASRGFLRDHRALETRVEKLLGLLDLPMSRLRDDSMLRLSGGMQQKIIIARWLLLQPDVLILDEPTRGVDIGTRASIYALLQSVADEGTGVLVVSSDFEELLGVCERVVVVSDGRSTADLPAGAVDEERLTLLAAPRSSMPRVQALLAALAERSGATCLWGVEDGEDLVCLARANGSAAPGRELRPGQSIRLDALGLGGAARGPITTQLLGDGRRVLAVRPDEAGRDNGMIALILPNGADAPDGAAVLAGFREALWPGSGGERAWTH